MPRGDDSMAASGHGPSASSPSKAFDPQQELRNKRELRKEIRDLTAKTHEFKQNGASYDPQSLLKMLKKGEQLCDKVNAPREALLDSQFLGSVADLGVQYARSMKSKGVGFDVDEFMSRIAKVIGGSLRTPSGGQAARKKRKSTGRQRAHNSDDEDEQAIEEEEDNDEVSSWQWKNLGIIAAKYTRRAPTMDHLVGPLAVEAKERKTGKKARLVADGDDDAEAAQPDTLNETEIQRSENETTRLVKQIAFLLDSKGGETGCNLFEFAINPKSFSNSVENLFYISFLIRDGQVALDDEGDNPPTLLRSLPPSEEDYQNGLKKRQIVMELDKATWRDLIQAYNITESIIPTRRATAQSRRGGWYG